MPRKEMVYAIYKGDRFIGSGTKKELESNLGLNIHTISGLNRPSYTSRLQDSDKRLRAVRLGYEGDDLDD